MYRLSFTIALLLVLLPVMSQSPHGDDLKMDCAECHTPDSWTLNFETLQFDHGTTKFELEGSHEVTDCKACHTDLTFKDTSTDCISCHLDVHNQSVGNDCMRCHNSDSWLVFNIPELHEQNGFPLIGAHTNLGCIECHDSASTLVFRPLGNECIECHRDDYMATTNPNHAISGFSTDCIECHSPFGIGWDAEGIIHDFFPLTLGHDIQNCTECHTNGDFTNTPTDCFACHSDDYIATTNPNHQTANFPTDCASCHSTNPGWMPATFDHDGMYFPIYSGAHEGEWNDCIDCHINTNNYSVFTCITCHEKNDMNDEHEGVSGYVYESNACFACHPNPN
ncbi:MAG: hypothetical protein KJO39_03500 [Bacteroidia bacterium]|nr:hypothetical protein [Bacteroidia bacterium]NNJ81967.1 hypothetical protein [Flavobacteriaceae bacterium]NNK54735.1 hypothetical protein [Flavobacteriaceae bacterium]NNM09720.1 hypothetical protein [Flavobacteriaceae bacterium]